MQEERLVVGCAVKHVYLNCPGTRVGMLDRKQIRNAIMIEITDDKGHVGRSVGRPDRGSDVQKESLVVACAVQDMDFQCSSAGAGLLERKQVRNAIMIEITDGKGHVGRSVGRPDRGSDVQKESLVIAGTTKDVDFQGPGASIGMFKREQVRDAVIIEVPGGKAHIGRSI